MGGEGRWAGDESAKIGGCSLRVGRGHYGGDYGDTVEGFAGGRGLIQHALAVFGVYAAYADGFYGGVGLGEAGEDGLYA